MCVEDTSPAPSQGIGRDRQRSHSVLFHRYKYVRIRTITIPSRVLLGTSFLDQIKFTKYFFTTCVSTTQGGEHSGYSEVQYRTGGDLPGRAIDPEPPDSNFRVLQVDAVGEQRLDVLVVLRLQLGG